MHILDHYIRKNVIGHLRMACELGLFQIILGILSQGLYFWSILNPENVPI